MRSSVSESQLSIALALLCGLVACRVAVLVAVGAGPAYSNTLYWSDGDTLLAASVTTFNTLAVCSSFAIAYSLWRRSRAWWQLALCVHVFVVVGGFLSLLLLGSVVLWWALKHAFMST